MLFNALEFVPTCVDNPSVSTKGSFEDHPEKLERVPHGLRKAGLKVNGNKSFFAKTELECPGHRITCNGMKPSSEKAKVIPAIDTSQNQTELKSFIDIVDHC